MNFIKFLDAIKTTTNKNLIENVIKKGFNCLFEDDETPILPQNIDQTDALIQKAEIDQKNLEIVKEKQAELAVAENEFKQADEQFEQNNPDLNNPSVT